MKKSETTYYRYLTDASLYISRVMEREHGSPIYCAHRDFIAKDIFIEVWQQRQYSHIIVIVIRKTSKGWRVKQ